MATNDDIHSAALSPAIKILSAYHWDKCLRSFGVYVDKEMNDSLFVFICNIYIHKTNVTTLDVIC